MQVGEYFSSLRPYKHSIITIREIRKKRVKYSFPFDSERGILDATTETMVGHFNAYEFKFMVKFSIWL